MRTTVTLEPDVEALIRRLMAERGISFKQAVNDSIRAGLRPGARKPFRTPTVSMGFDPRLPWDKALSMAAELEDEELIRRLAARK